jgi:hypothetical protein
VTARGLATFAADYPSHNSFCVQTINWRRALRPETARTRPARASSLLSPAHCDPLPPPQPLPCRSPALTRRKTSPGRSKAAWGSVESSPASRALALVALPGPLRCPRPPCSQGRQGGKRQCSEVCRLAVSSRDPVVLAVGTSDLGGLVYPCPCLFPPLAAAPSRWY